MLKYLIVNLLFIVLVSEISGSSPCSDAGEKSGSNFFPTNRNISLIYNSSFGHTISKFYNTDDFLISGNEGDRFKYIQKIFITETGVYVNEVYQYFKVMIFISKEKLFTYNKPVLRLPLPLVSGKSWDWEGEEYSDGDTSVIKLSGRVLDKELVSTPAGNFESIKVETKISSSSGSENNIVEWYVENIGIVKAIISINGGGLMGMIRKVMGYAKIEFELKEIKNN
jgi:hypothetical protein